MSTMAGQADTSAAHRTDNHVKRVSCCSSRPATTSVSVISALVLVVVLGPSLATAGDISCQGIRYTYFNKGLDTSDIPAAPRQGKNRIPPSPSPGLTYYPDPWKPPPSFCHHPINHPETFLKKTFSEHCGGGRTHGGCGATFPFCGWDDNL